MAREGEIIRYLQQLQGGRQTSTHSNIPIIYHDVYSSNPEDLPLCDGMEEAEKLYYCTPLRHRGAAASGIDRSTPDGRWKARDWTAVIVSNERNEIRFIPWRAIDDEIRAMEGEGLTTIGFRKKFAYIKKSNPEQNTKWAMMEYTFYPPELGRENRYAVCYVYKTKQDGRQRNGNGNGRVNEQQLTNHNVGESSTSAPAQFKTLKEVDDFLNASP